jgi:transcriptional regulator with XRE-family HTH domain
MARYEARFQPEAWVNGQAIQVDPEGPTSWDCTELADGLTAYLAGCARRQGEAFDDGFGVVDNDDLFKTDPAAPEWVRAWSGPFTIRILTRACPDRGTCHHQCAVNGPCFRVLCCGPLSGVYPGGRWPQDVLAAAGVAPAHPDPIPAHLRDARRFLGLSQEEVATALGIPRSSVSAMENGHRNVTGLELRRLARLYRRPVGWLLGEDVEPDEELLAAARHLAEHDKALVLQLVQFLAGAREGNGGC